MEMVETAPLPPPQKSKIVKEHRIQVRWLHYDTSEKKLTSVRQKNGGGNRFIAYADTDSLKLKDLVENSPTVPSSGKPKIATPLVSQIHLFISFK